jgi:hypothetical protein
VGGGVYLDDGVEAAGATSWRCLGVIG